MLKVKAYAKINLFLDILGRRPDSYHDIRTVMQSISLCDELSFNAMCSESVVIYDTFPGKDDEDDLVKKALELVQTQSGVGADVLIDVWKRIPVAAGLGGGSADAAATIAGLNRLFKLSLPDATVGELAERLGADVPFFLEGGTRLAEGTGSDLRKLPDVPKFFVVVMDPGVEVSTKWAYEAFDEADLKDKEPGKDVSPVLKAIEGADYGMLCASLYNAFEGIVFAKYPEIERVKEAALDAGADAAMMTGSGSAVFALAQAKEKADGIADKMERSVKDIYVNETCQSGLEIVE